MIELFSGAKVFTNEAKSRGHTTCSVDNDPKLNADMTEDVRNIIEFSFKPDVIWASPPCESFSVASIGKHWTGGSKAYEPKSQQALDSLELVKATTDLIQRESPKYWFIENPRGMLRKVIPDMPNSIRHTVTYCQYGETRMKPTDIWTNCTNWTPRPACKNGDPCHVAAPRGSRTGTQGYKNYYERSKLPQELVEEVLDAVCQ